MRASAQKAREGLLARISDGGLASRSGSRNPKTEAKKSYDAIAAAERERERVVPTEVKKKERVPQLPKPPPSRYAWWCKMPHELSDTLRARALECPTVRRFAMKSAAQNAPGVRQARAFFNFTERKTAVKLRAELLIEGEWEPAKATDWEQLESDSSHLRGWETCRDETAALRKAASEAAMAQIEQPLDLLLQIAGQKRRSAIRKQPKSRRTSRGNKGGRGGSSAD